MKENVCVNVKNVAVKTENDIIQNYGKKQKRGVFCVLNLTHLYYYCFFLDDMKDNVCVNMKNVAVKTENEENDKEADDYQNKKVKKRTILFKISTSLKQT